MGINKELTLSHKRFIFFEFLENQKPFENLKNSKQSEIDFDYNISEKGLISDSFLCFIVNSKTKKFGKILKENIYQNLQRMLSYKLKDFKIELMLNGKAYCISIKNELNFKENNYSILKTSEIKSKFRLNVKGDSEKIICEKDKSKIGKNKLTIKQFMRIIEHAKTSYIKSIHDFGIISGLNFLKFVNENSNGKKNVCCFKIIKMKNYLKKNFFTGK